MLIYRFRRYEDYQEHLVLQESVLAARHKMLLQEEESHNGKDDMFSVKGFSITANQEVKFLVDWHYSDGEHINWRERLVCPVTGLNNRQRASYHLYLSEMTSYKGDKVYMTEQVTDFHTFMKLRIPGLIGSEYVDPNMEPGQMTDSGVRHEDLTNLSFKDSSLDKVISFDCLEHIPEYKKAIAECFRVLKPNGAMLASFPFNKNKYDTLIRAEILADGSTVHHTDAEYHGDPLSDEGCLSYYTFGWDVLDIFRSAGFNHVYAIVYWSDVFGYLGDEQIVFVAKK